MTVATAENSAPRQRIALRRTEWLLLAGVLLLTVLIRLPGHALPLERDEGAYGYVAFDWLYGGLPYRDAFDHKPPLIYGLYMPALLWGALGVRVWATMLHLACVVLVYAIGRRAWQGAGALLAALLFAAAGSAFDMQGAVLNTDQALVLPALAALACALHYSDTQRPGLLVAAGALIAAATLIKPVAAVLAFPLLLTSGWRLGQWGRIATFAMLGAALIAVPLISYFALRGGWSDLQYALFSYNTLYAGESGTRFNPEGLAQMYAPFVPLTVVAIGGVALLFTRAAHSRIIRRRRDGLIVAAWGAALLLAAVASLRPWVHYYYPVLPFLALLAAPALLWLAHSAGDARPRGFAMFAAPLLVAVLVLPFVTRNALLVGASPAALAGRLYGDDGRSYFANAAAVAAFVRERTAPEDRIYVFGSEPEVYFLARRRASSRWIYDYPLRLVDGAQAELLRDLQARPPALAVVYYGLRPPGLIRLIEQRGFAKLAQIGQFEVFGPAETN